MQVAFPFQERYTRPEKVIHPKLPLETSLDVPRKHNMIKTVWDRVLVCFEEATNQASSFLAAIEGATRIRPSFTNTYIWSGARRFQSQYMECNVYGIDRVGNVLEIIKTK